MNRAAYLSTFGVVVLLLAAGAQPASAPVKLGIRVTELPGQGLGVDAVEPKSLAAAVGLKERDLIGSITTTRTEDGKRVPQTVRPPTLGQLQQVLGKTPSEITVVYRRQGVWYSANVQLAPGQAPTVKTQQVPGPDATTPQNPGPDTKKPKVPAPDEN